MANSYKFKGVALATGSETALLTAATDETLIIIGGVVGALVGFFNMDG